MTRTVTRGSHFNRMLMEEVENQELLEWSKVPHIHGPVKNKVPGKLKRNIDKLI